MSVYDMQLFKKTIFLVAMSLISYGAFNAAMAEAPIAGRDTERNIMLAQKLAECSGTYYASSEIVKKTRGRAETSKAFHEKANGYLLAAAWKLNSAEPKGGFDSAFERAEKRTGEIKKKWLDHVVHSGHDGVDRINLMSEKCTAHLDTIQQSIVQKMKKIRAQSR